MKNQLEPTLDGIGHVRAPAAIIVSGPPASGKTTLATALASALRYAIMDLDTVTGPLTRAAMRSAATNEAALDTPAGQQLRASRYETLLDIAAANLEIGIGVVLAAPFTEERSAPDRFGYVVRRLRPGNPDDGVALLYIDAPADVVRMRLETRNAPRDRAKLLRSPAGTGPAPPLPSAIVLDGTQGVAEQLAAALVALARLADPHASSPQAPPC